jgi:hypothetical protein
VHYLLYETHFDRVVEPLLYLVHTCGDSFPLCRVADQEELDIFMSWLDKILATQGGGSSSDQGANPVDPPPRPTPPTADGPADALFSDTDHSIRDIKPQEDGGDDAKQAGV